MQNRILFLGVPIDSLTQKEAIQHIKSLLLLDGQHHVVTPNSEMIVEASRNSNFHDLLNKTELNLPDSAGLLFAAKLIGQNLPERVTGVDTVRKLCAELDEFNTVFLLGAQDGVAERTAEVLISENPNLQIVGCLSGSPKPEDAEQLISIINKSSPSLLLVAYGAPTQDFWIDKYLSRIPSVKVAMGVGGTFDFIAGKIRRAPKIIQKLYLEWLWRLCLEPRRIGRIFTAVVVFPVLIIFSRNKH
ncbi:MAG: WecB/TagA/CpsF family glycosyltransferase [Candidatus Peribacteraceae bacterium]|nr:WecB/TagA/CpsF family glycosyltransferase [Candidatus Peribacteraceae bacterium]